jgi:hypothetical protein
MEFAQDSMLAYGKAAAKYDRAKLLAARADAA